MYKIIIDNAIPYIKGILEPYFEVVYVAGSDINATNVKDCDAMFIRTRTHCNSELLQGSRVKFIGSATIGIDHIDTEYCDKSGIEVRNAAGCNARAVAQWVLAAIMEQDKTNPTTPQSTIIGVIGVGNVGSVVAQLFEDMGFTVLKSDPPKAKLDPKFQDSPIEYLLEKSDIVTFHTPLTKNGEHPTYHLLGGQNLKALNPNATILNSSRGGVIDEKALLEAFSRGELENMMIDVWEDEPNINLELLEKSLISTPHIAGYSSQGKANATSMIVEQISKFFNITELTGWYPNEVPPLNASTEISWANLKRLMPLHYNIISDSDSLKSHPNDFEQHRNSYIYRTEFF